MSPDIMVGMVGPATSPPSAGPPGSPDLAALFADLLARSGSPPTGSQPIVTEVRDPSVPQSERIEQPLSRLSFRDEKPAPKNTEPTQNVRLASLPPPALPIKNRIFTLLTTPPNAGAAAETQNAMDTVPVSVSPQTKNRVSKPGGELPLPEARTVASMPLPTFPGVFLIVPASSQAVAPSVTVSAKAATVPGVVTALPAALPRATSQAVPFSLPPSAAPMTVALPTAFTLPKERAVETAAIKTQNRPSPVQMQGAVSRALTSPISPLFNGGRGSGAVLGEAVAQSQVLKLPYGMTAQAHPMPVTVSVEPTPQSEVVLAPPEPPLPIVPAAKAVETVKTAPELPKTAVIRLPNVVMTQTEALAPLVSAAALPLAAAALAPARQAGISPPPAAPEVVAPASIVPVVTDSKVKTATLLPVEDAVPLAKTTESKTETPLKSRPAPADNNTRIQYAPVRKAVATTQPLQVVGKRSERRGDSAKIAEPVLSQTPAAPVSVGKPVTAPLTHAERVQMVRQTAEAVAATPLPARPGAASQMTLQLHPKDWGQLQISVRVVPVSSLDATRTQAVTAHVIAETPQVKAALENGAGDLRHALREAGLHLDRLTVTVQSAGESRPAGTATSGGHHPSGDGGSGFGQNLQQKADASNSSSLGGSPNGGTSSFTGGAGDSQGRRQGQTPNFPATAVDALEREDSLENAPRILVRGQIDTRA